MTAPAWPTLAQLSFEDRLIKEVNPMATTTTPYHSSDPTDPRVYHDYSDCPNGQQISPENLMPGTGNLPRCGSCQNMD
ncbi:hypothetical protein BH23ACT4_BH23ACT4_14100 [soil metagenome]